LAAGACGYLLKDTHVDRLADSIRQAAAGHMVLSGAVAKALIARVRAEARDDAQAPPADASAGRDGTSATGVAAAAAEKALAQRPALTPREREVLRLIVEGADNVAIGRELSISRHTVKQYVTNIFEKLDVHSRVQAAVYAVRAGLM
jgi:DNA-binding NarL/FixJ family response regulator